jgi:hypothetical protein
MNSITGRFFKSVQAESAGFVIPGQGSVLILLLRSPAVVQLLDLFSCSVRALIFRMDLFIFCDWRCCLSRFRLSPSDLPHNSTAVFPVRSRVLRSVLAADPFCFFFLGPVRSSHSDFCLDDFIPRLCLTFGSKERGAVLGSGTVR